MIRALNLLGLALVRVLAAAGVDLSTDAMRRR